MTITAEKLTLEAYLTHTDGTDTRYELVDGDLVTMALGSGEHGAITDFLADIFKSEIRRQQLPLTVKQMMLGIQSPRGTRWDTVCIPDLVVLPKSQWVELRQREAVIRLNEPPPLLVVEVVSPSTQSEDYRAKYAEYSVLDISEYWIVDPLATKITICQLNEGRYDDRCFTGEDRLDSGLFGTLELSVIDVLRAEEAL
jgi:Uma2 family endonuclease